jgi:hypothetical protein
MTLSMITLGLFATLSIVALSIECHAECHDVMLSVVMLKGVEIT